MEEAEQARHSKSHKNGKQQGAVVRSRHHKTRKSKRKPPSATQDSQSPIKTAGASDTSSLSSPTIINAGGGQSLIHKRRTKAACSHDDTSHDNESLATRETLDVSTISPGAFPVSGPNSSAIHDETPDRNNIIDETENVDDTHDLVVAAKVVPDQEEMEAEMKQHLESKIKEEVAMRFMIEGRAPVLAEAVRTSNYKARWRTWGCVLFVVILIIVATVIVVVTTKKQEENNQSPSVEKDISHQQDENNSPSVSNNTTATVVTCLGSTPIQQGQAAISSWIDQGTRPDGLVYSSACTFEQVSGPSTWFSLIGTGDVYVVSTCSKDLSFDSAISVTTGPCANLQCVGYADFTQGYCRESSYGAATVLFRTDVGIPYYIGVEGINSPTHWNFTLSITTVVHTPPNSDCSNSIVIEPGESIVRGTITNATQNRHFNNTCTMTGDLPSVWYTMVGTGDVFEISTCNSDLTFDAGISVSTGSCEDTDRECLVSTTYDSYACLENPYISARVSFLSQFGVEYFLQVHPAIMSSWNGDFALDISIGEPPGNDNCSSATLVEAGTSSVLGSISHSTWDTNMNIMCSLGTWDTKIVWYSLIGTGEIHSISTCSSVLTFDSTISVMTGDCSSLECLIPGMDVQRDCPEAPYRAATILLRTEVGVEYFIAVEATNYTWEGEFSLGVSVVEPLPNDECSGATDIQANAGPIYGTTRGATSSTNMYSDPRPDLWYRMVGNGTNTVASICGEATTYDPITEVFQGDEGYCNQTLIASTVEEDSCRLEWYAILGVTYYIRVSGWCGDEDQFELQVTFV